MSNASRDLELLVARIQQQLAPKSDVRHNVMLDGRYSNRKRQIDVLVSEKIGQYDIKIIIDCKDYKSPVDVKGVEEFSGLLNDVGAQKGVLVCPRGFTSTAKTRAEGLQIDLYSPVDTDAHKWKAKVTIPATCDFRNVQMSFGFSTSAPYPLKLFPNFFSDCMVFDGSGNALGFILDSAKNKWDTGALPTEVGEHNNLPVFDAPETLVDNGYGQRIPVELTVSTLVQRDLYFGQLLVPRISGFKDELSGQVITNAFTFGLVSPEEIERDWQRITTETEAPINPVIALVGTVWWGEEGEVL